MAAYTVIYNLSSLIRDPEQLPWLGWDVISGHLYEFTIFFRDDSSGVSKVPYVQYFGDFVQKTN